MSFLSNQRHRRAGRVRPIMPFVQIALVVLRAVGVLHIAWVWILAPLWVSFALIVLGFGLGQIGEALHLRRLRRRNDPAMVVGRAVARAALRSAEDRRSAARRDREDALRDALRDGALGEAPAHATGLSTARVTQIVSEPPETEDEKP